MDTITGMRTFCAVAHEASFVKAAKTLGISPALTSKYVGQLEERLGVQLLNRTTRSLSLTESGGAYLISAERLVSEFDEIETSVQASQNVPRGSIVVSAPTTFGETQLTKAMAQFLIKYPDISVDLRLTDRFVDIVDEGVDVAVRVGSLKDSSLIAKKLAAVKIYLCATSRYLEKHGMPREPNDLAQHSCIDDSNFQGGQMWPFVVNGEKITVKAKGRFRSNSANAAREIALNDLGIMISPDHIVEADLAAGRLVLLLQDFNAFDLGLYAVYPQNRHLAVKVRVFVDFLTQWFAKK